MRTQNTIYDMYRNITGLFVILCLGFLVNPAAMANSADWGLVKRFEAQLEEAQQGKVSAMYEVGRLFERGRGTSKSLESAISWYKKASDGGHDSAKARLGKMYLEGRGVKKDLDKASELITEAANKDIPVAQYQLGVMYEIGIGRNEDNSKALYWYKKAAALGHYQAERKAKQLKNAGSSPFIASSAKKPKTSAKKPASKKSNESILKSIAEGSWKRRKKAVGYLPSSINNCKVVIGKIRCVSSDQERSTGSEIITYSTESSIEVTGKNKFHVKYINNVQEVEVLKTENISGVEDDEVVETTSTSTSIHKGKQEKVHELNCTLKNKKSITCTKGGYRTLKFTS
jgi:hypothetical protein